MFSTYGAFESLIKSSACLPQITSGVPLPLLLSLSHTHSHKDTHIPKVYFPRGNFIRTLPATLRNWLLPSCADAESKIHCNQFSPFLSSVIVTPIEGSPALSSFCPEGGTVGS